MTQNGEKWSKKEKPKIYEMTRTDHENMKYVVKIGGNGQICVRELPQNLEVSAK